MDNSRDEGRAEDRIEACAMSLRAPMTDYLRDSGTRKIDVEAVIARLSPQARQDGWTDEEIAEAVSILAEDLLGRMEPDLRGVDPAIEHPSGYIPRS